MCTRKSTGPRRAQIRPSRALAVVAACAMLAACAHDDPVQSMGGRGAGPRGPAAVINPVCDYTLGGQIHDEFTIDTPTIWTRANNPHLVYQPPVVTSAGRLTLEPGVVVCFVSGSHLVMQDGGRLVANGLDTAHIVLTAADPAAGWWGLYFRGTAASSSSLRNVDLDHIYTGAYAITAVDSNAVAIDSSVFRQAGTGIYLGSRGSSISRSLVDTTTNAAWPAITMEKQTRFENTVIRGAAGVGLGVYGTYGISLLGGRIEGSGGVGLQVTTTGAGMVAAQPIRVVGGASYPAELAPSAFARLYPAVADQDSLLGNARDTVVVTGGILQQFAYPSPALPWRVTGEIIVQYFGILRPSPGASLAFTSGGAITARNGGRLVARGTQASPVRFTAADTAVGWSGIALEGAPSLSSYLTNVRVEYASVLGHYGVGAVDSHPLVIDSAVFRQNRNPLVLVSSGTRLSRSRVDTTRYVVTAVYLSSNAVIESTLIRGASGVGLSVYSSSAQVLSCEIRGSGGAGIELQVAAPVHNCNLVDNGGPGISNLDTATANVENNWWGDTAGPTGPAGDGASGPLDYTPGRTAAYALPYVP